MATPLELSTTIIKELVRLRTVSASDRDVNDPFSLPRMIIVVDGRTRYTSEQINNAIHDIADHLRSEDASLLSRVMLGEWRKTVRSAFWQELDLIDLDDRIDQNAAQVLREVRASVRKHMGQVGTRENAFGCTLFRNTTVKPFSIGPVRFEPRKDWLERLCEERAISKTTRRRVEQILPGKKLRKRRKLFERIIEENIIEAVGTCPYVCSVVTVGLAPDAARERALTAARMALAAIVLLWPTPSRALEEVNLWYDRRHHQQTELSIMPGKTGLAGSIRSHATHASMLRDGAWETNLSQHSTYFDGVAEILNYVIDPSSRKSRGKMLSTLAQALLWFHEGCRESVTLMGIVKFTAALEALACGGKAKDIKRLITARLGLQETAPIWPDGPLMGAEVDRIYSDGRSLTVHGNNKYFYHDWSETKALSEHFARRCLLACIEWANENPTSDDPKLLQK